MFPTERPRRVRGNDALRRLARETDLSPRRLIAPLFAVDGTSVRSPIEALPGQFRLSVDRLVEEAKALADLGVGGVLVFGAAGRKDAEGAGADAPDACAVRALRALREAVGGRLAILADVCLCAYTNSGHCGILDARGGVDNDRSIERLAEIAVAYARAGADVVAPSDMMDGRVARIRRALDASDLPGTPILSYAAKFASAFYGPFREAVDSAPRGGAGDRRAYQLDPAQAREALREIALDLAEGADAVMVKPALPYLDVIRAARERFDAPIAAFNVSGEYAMVKAAAAKGWLDERAAAEETLLSIRRAGADWILTYWARDAARWRG